jgi:molybdate transport system ATP-binding protein
MAERSKGESMSENLVARFNKRFAGGFEIDIDFTQSATESNVTALLGPSGCGKTTLLRCLAGLTHPDRGEISFSGQSWFSRERRLALPPQQRDIGFLFQEYALFPHLTVAENVGFSLKKHSAQQQRQRVSEMIRLFELQGLEGRLPDQLSGGQQQRVALARAVARRPSLLLLDEPLSALDSQLREQLRGTLRRLFTSLGIPVILVTHDRIEAMTLADRIAVLDRGSIQQIGPMQDVFNRPQNAELARLVGMETVVPGEIVQVQEGLATVHVAANQLLAVAPENSERFVDVCIKGEDVALQRGDCVSSSVRNHLPARIKSLTHEGPLVRVGLDCGFELTALVTRPASDELRLTIGDSVLAMVKAPAIHLIPRAVPSS